MTGQTIYKFPRSVLRFIYDPTATWTIYEVAG